MLAYSHEGINIDGQAYNWSRGKEFSAAQAMSNYMRYGIGPETILVQKDFSEDISRISENISLVVNQVASHPEIQYRFLFPPYSMLWWDCAYVNGDLDERFYILEQTVPALLSFPNVEIYFFQDESSIVLDLDNYMDMVHYSPAINQHMLEKMQAGEYRVTEDNWEEIMGRLKEMVAHITQEEIYKY